MKKGKVIIGLVCFMVAFVYYIPNCLASDFLWDVSSDLSYEKIDPSTEKIVDSWSGSGNRNSTTGYSVSSNSSTISHSGTLSIEGMTVTGSQDGITAGLTGSGTSNDPYVIQSRSDFDEFITNSDYWDSHIRLENDIDLSGIEYSEAIIASDKDSSNRSFDGIAFNGVFDGTGHSISSVTINGLGKYIGVFGQIGEGGIVKNLHVSITAIVAGDYITGGLAGKNDGRIENCSVTGNISGNYQVGGITGYNNGALENSYSQCTIMGNNYSYVGGLAGFNMGNISSSFSDSMITARNNTGGLVGENRGTIENCYSSGILSYLYSANNIGGLVGNNTGIISYCYSLTKIDLPISQGSIGGFVGRNDYNGEVNLSFWNLDTSEVSYSNGGFGRTTTEMKNSVTFVGWKKGNWTIDNGNDFPRLYWENKSGIEIDNIPLRIYDGTGNQLDPFVISDALDLVNMTNRPEDWDSYFILDDDINMELITNYIPPGNFTGVFDGNFHSVNNLTLNASTAFIGLFGVLDGGIIQNLKIENANISGQFLTGGLVGLSKEGTIIRCSSNANVTGNSFSSDIGGLVGKSVGSDIQKCFSGGSVSSGDNSNFIGGLVGYSYAYTVITNCYSNNSITAGSDSDSVGGLVGKNVGADIFNSYSVSPIATIGNSSNIGALVGDNYNNNKVSNCYWMNNTVSPDISDGGFGKTESEMKEDSTFIGWEPDTWTIDIGNSFPHLAWENESGVIIDNTPQRSYAGNGTQFDPFVLASEEDLICMTQRPMDWSSQFIIVYDIEMTPGRKYQPPANFGGTIDGLGHKIINLVINENTSYLGLIGYLDDGEIRNLRLENVSIRGYRTVGGIVGCNDRGRIIQCSIDGAISSVDNADAVGGLIGSNYNGSIQLSYSEGTVVAGDNSNSIGGLVGENLYQTAIENSFSHCFVTSGDNSGSIAGLIGYIWYGTVNNCYSTGQISVGGVHKNVGGLVGSSGYNTIVNNSFWDIDASGVSSSSIGEGKTTVELKDIITFLNAGWDFVNEDINGTEDVWEMSQINGYPMLHLVFKCQNDEDGDGDVDGSDLAIIIHSGIRTNFKDAASEFGKTDCPVEH